MLQYSLGFVLFIIFLFTYLFYFWGRYGRDRMVVGFTTTYEISDYHN